MRQVIRKTWWGRALLVLAAVIAGVVAVAYAAVRGSARVQAASPADCIIVLGCGYEPPDWPPMMTYRDRLRGAADLYEAGMAPKIITTELAPCAQIAKEYLVDLGVPEEDVLYEDRSHTTWENLVHAHEVMREHDMRTAIVVSDGFHMRRALQMCKDLGIPAEGAASPYSVIEQIPYRRVKYSLRDAVNLIFYYARRPWLEKPKAPTPPT